MACKHQTTRRVKTILAACALSALGLGGLKAAVLKDLIEVEDKVVRLADLFIAPEGGAETIIMAAPAPGKSKSISAFELQALAQSNGIVWERPPLLKSVKIKRAGTLITKADLSQLIKSGIRNEGVRGQITVRLFGSKKSVYLPAGASTGDLSLETLEMNGNKDRFTAVLSLPSEDGENSTLTLTGSIEQIREVPVLAHAVTPGEMISLDDISWEAFPVKRLGRTTVQTIDALIGMTLRRPIRAGNLIRTTDVMRPQLVKKGSAVKISLNNGAMHLTSTGKALENGGKGDLIRVMNLVSKKTIEARITAHGQVEIVTAQSFAQLMN